MHKKKYYILMVVYNAIQYDARVIRAAEAINTMGENVVVISCNSDISYKNNHFNSLVFTSKLKGPLLLIAYWLFILNYCILHKKEIILIYLHDYFLVFVGKLLKRLLKLNWVYDAHELILDSKRIKQNKRNSCFAWLEKVSINSASLVVAANDERKKYMKRIYHLSNIISVLNVSPLSKTFVSHFKKENIIVYQGVMSESRKVSNLIKMLKFLPTDIKLKLIGDGPDLLSYKKLVEENKFEDRVIFTGKIPYSNLLEESKNCMLGIVVYQLEGLNNYYCSPNKIFEYALIKLPMLMSSQPFLEKIVKKYNIGETIYPTDSLEKQAENALKIIRNNEMYIKNMDAFLSDYSYENEMRKLINCVSDIIK